ncbi:MAG: Tyrosine--tRNA ligase [Candidatus Magasanikbacteria bacterium]|nr:Tyrosine--tRNA ligase [Candidatus Magasanikbacteria bacterium]
MKILTDKKKIDEVLTRGVDKIYPTKETLAARMAKGPIKLYLGVDPTGGDLHIGHSVALRKLEQFRRLGHKVILLIGSFTARIGDPSGKSASRKPLTKEQVLANAKDYKKQASKVLNFDDRANPVEMRMNGEWWDKMFYGDFLKIAGHFTVQQLLERDMFERRLKEGQPITMPEILYPVMQGYDSVALTVDAELGGTDQTFNMLVGRALMKETLGKEKFVITVPILEDSRGVKIGKTEGNVIALAAPPDDLFGKIMSLGDDVIVKCFDLCTDVPSGEVREIERALLGGANPRDFKMRLAEEIVKMYHGAATARDAAEEFVAVHRGHTAPTKNFWWPSGSPKASPRRGR